MILISSHYSGLDLSLGKWGICPFTNEWYVLFMKNGFLAMAMVGFLFSNLPVPVQAGLVKSCCCGETDQPCHSPMVPSPCSACPSPSTSAVTLPSAPVELSLPTSSPIRSEQKELSASVRTERPLLTPPRILS